MPEGYHVVRSNLVLAFSVTKMRKWIAIVRCYLSSGLTTVDVDFLIAICIWLFQLSTALSMS